MLTATAQGDSKYLLTTESNPLLIFTGKKFIFIDCIIQASNALCHEYAAAGQIIKYFMSPEEKTSLLVMHTA